MSPDAVRWHLRDSFVQGLGGWRTFCQPVEDENRDLGFWDVRRRDEAGARETGVLADHEDGQRRKLLEETVGLDGLKELAEALPGNAD